MQFAPRHLVVGLALLALTGCVNRELGTDEQNGDFGNSTMNNTMIMSGERTYTSTLANRFASEVPSTITFAFNSATLDESARATLRQQANWIRQFPEVRFRVYGHTDLVGSEAYNRALGLRRAKAVVSYFSSLGISRSRLEAIASFGKTQPVVQTTGPEQRNRRTVTEVSGFVSSHPTVLNGKYAAIIYRDYLLEARRPHPPNTIIATQTNPAGE
ncbi:OmpA family protein [Paracoccaceae bacterium Fryx2]|nr:OmpA family protein [Paracoccaceae bacterium Fryx2]